NPFLSWTNTVRFVLSLSRRRQRKREKRREEIPFPYEIFPHFSFLSLKSYTRRKVGFSSLLLIANNKPFLTAYHSIAVWRMYADREDAENRRSIKDRLNGSFRDDSNRRRQFTGKRQRQDDKWEHDLYEDNEAQVSNRQIDSRDLRLKLQRKNQQASVSGRGSHSGVRDLREKLSGSMHPQPVNYDPHKPSLEAAKPTRRSVANSAAKKKAPQKA
ncbi:hypothetical protein F8388_009121, partial [Cannabis sativa]